MAAGSGPKITDWALVDRDTAKATPKASMPSVAPAVAPSPQDEPKPTPTIFFGGPPPQAGAGSSSASPVPPKATPASVGTTQPTAAPKAAGAYSADQWNYWWATQGSQAAAQRDDEVARLRQQLAAMQTTAQQRQQQLDGALAAIAQPLAGTGFAARPAAMPATAPQAPIANTPSQVNVQANLGMTSSGTSVPPVSVQASPLGTQSATQIHQPPHLPKSVPLTSLPDPETSWVLFERAFNEYTAEARMHNNVSFQITRAVKAQLSTKLQGLVATSMSIADMQVNGSEFVLLRWLKKRFNDVSNEVECQSLTADFEKFKRTGPNMRDFIDQFEHFQTRRIPLSLPELSDEELKRLLIAKAQLPTAVEAEMMLALQRIRAANGTTSSTYAEVREQLLLIAQNPNLFVTRGQYAAQTVVDDDDSVPHTTYMVRTPYHLCRHFQRDGYCTWGDHCKFVHSGANETTRAHNYAYAGARAGERSWTPHRIHYAGYGERRGRSTPRSTYHDRSRSRSKGKGKGKGKGKRDRSRSFNRDRFFNGSSSHHDRSRSRSYNRDDRSRDRSRSPRDRKGGKGSRKGRSPSSSRGARDICRDFQRGRCDRGDRCRYKHDNSSPSPSPSFGGRRRFPDRSRSR
jgi:hypothetical protein